MTQMGLDYQKHLETRRHNLASEVISQQDADTRSKEADTHAYTASFKEREVSASEKQADAAKIKADQYQRELDIKQESVDATNRGNTLKYLNEQALSNPIYGKLTLALPFLLSEGIINQGEFTTLQQILSGDHIVEKNREWNEKFEKGETTAWANPTMASFR